MSLHVGSADRVSGMDEFSAAIADEFGVRGVKPKLIAMDDWNTEWDTLYPFSQVRVHVRCFAGHADAPHAQFVEPFRIALPTPEGYRSPWADKFKLDLTTQSLDRTANARGLTISIKHPGVIWTGMHSSS